MCEICGRAICHPQCPGSDGYRRSWGAPHGCCVFCGEEVYRGSRALLRGRDLVCGACVEAADLEAILEICGCKDAGELLEEVGFLPAEL